MGVPEEFWVNCTFTGAHKRLFAPVYVKSVVWDCTDKNIHTYNIVSKSLIAGGIEGNFEKGLDYS